MDPRGPEDTHAEQAPGGDVETVNESDGDEVVVSKGDEDVGSREFKPIDPALENVQGDKSPVSLDSEEQGRGSRPDSRSSSRPSSRQKKGKMHPTQYSKLNMPASKSEKGNSKGSPAVKAVYFQNDEKHAWKGSTTNTVQTPILHAEAGSKRGKPALVAVGGYMGGSENIDPARDLVPKDTTGEIYYFSAPNPSFEDEFLGVRTPINNLELAAGENDTNEIDDDDCVLIQRRIESNGGTHAFLDPILNFRHRSINNTVVCLTKPTVYRYARFWVLNNPQWDGLAAPHIQPDKKRRLETNHPDVGNKKLQVKLDAPPIQIEHISDYIERSTQEKLARRLRTLDTELINSMPDVNEDLLLQSHLAIWSHVRYKHERTFKPYVDRQYTSRFAAIRSNLRAAPAGIALPEQRKRVHSNKRGSQ